MQTIAAILFTILTGVVILFQAGLAAGFPWGSASMGGRFPGRYPPKMRVVAFILMLVLGCIAAMVLSKAGLMLSGLKPISTIGIWFVVAFFTLGAILNTITPSKIERIWAPVALIQAVTSLMVAIS